MQKNNSLLFSSSQTKLSRLT